MAVQAKSPRRKGRSTMVLRDAWWNELPQELVSDLPLIAFADTSRGVLMLRPDTYAALEAHARRDMSAPVESAVREVLRQAIRLVMPVLSREGWRTCPQARTIDLVMADTAAAWIGQKCGVTTAGEAKKWLPCSPFREAVDVFDRLARGNLGRFEPIDAIHGTLAGWLLRWYQPRPGPRRALSGEEYVQQATDVWLAPYPAEDHAGMRVILAAFQDGVRPGCPIGQGPQAPLQAILDGLGADADEGHVVAAYRRLLQHPATTDLEIEIFMRCIDLSTRVWRHLAVMDAAFGRMPAPLHHTLPPPPPDMRPADRAACAQFRTGLTQMELTMELHFAPIVQEAEHRLQAGEVDSVIEAMQYVVARAPNQCPPSLRTGDVFLVRFWQPDDVDARRDAGEFTDADLSTGAAFPTVWPRAYFTLACALAQANRLDEAEAALDAGERLDPDTHFAIERAAICAMRGDPSRAMQLFSEVLTRPGHVRNHHRAMAERGMGVHLMDLGDYRGAMQALQRAEHALPDHPGTRREMAYLFAQIFSNGQLAAPMARTLNTAIPKCAACGAVAMDGARSVFVEREGLYLCQNCQSHWTGAEQS